jgi:hypothetical protein
LRTAAEVRDWRAALRRFGPAEPVTFDLHGVSADENRWLSGVAERHRHACGCEAGGFAGMLAVILAAFLWLVPDVRPALTLSNAAVTAGAIIAASVLARLAALGWARAALIRLAGQIERSSH